MSRATMTTEQLAVTREYALRVGKAVARKIFEKRGNHSEVHLREADLSSIAAVVFELGFQAARETNA